MNSMNLMRLQQFYYVAREGSLTKAAEILNISTSALCRSIKYFEHSLKIDLFRRVAKGMVLTPQGERLYEQAKKTIQEMQTFETIFRGEENGLGGEIRIMTTPLVASEWLIPHLKGFLEIYPHVNIKIFVEKTAVNPLEADITISPFIPHHSHLIQKHLYTVQTCFFASESYLKKFGEPRELADLHNHKMIGYKKNILSLFAKTTRILNLENNDCLINNPYFEVESMQGMKNAALHGFGIVELPNYSFITTSGLKEILPQLSKENIAMYYIYSEAQQSSKKINLLYDYLSQKGR
ncbi:MAG TPA: LysR family transcriptional regulator [Candidatus Nitrosotenuis sp.]|jgi:DNA-binding transcriptional LysR family regulator|nr:LysR family transcriptional regulator [Candidatus Nitrosotenuis sp.]